jgi:NAD(P)-dependent dehydrogenase (short-subunit alcohol dehydrogenase family)
VKTVLVTGASSGIGLATARLLADHGYRVLGTSRDPGRIADPLPGVDYLALDLGDRDSIRACAEAAGAVDVLVNNAGESQSGPLEELPLAAIDRLFQLNVFGPVQLTQLVLPGMRERRSGRVVMVGSMLASFPLAFRSSYVASKAAIKGFADAARVEVAPYGIGITTVEPGSINTGISERRTMYIAEDSTYADRFRTMLRALDGNEKRGIAAEKVAATIVKAIEDQRPRRLYAVGSNAPLVFALKRALPRELSEKVVARRHGLS